MSMNTNFIENTNVGFCVHTTEYLKGYIIVVVYFLFWKKKPFYIKAIAMNRKGKRGKFSTEINTFK